MKKELSPHVTEVLREMCRRVDTDFDSVDFHADNWYMEHRWTKAEEDDFTRWLAKYLCANRSAWVEMLGPSVRKKLSRAKKAAGEFVWNYGWKVEK